MTIFTLVFDPAQLVVCQVDLHKNYISFMLAVKLTGEILKGYDSTVQSLFHCYII